MRCSSSTAARPSAPRIFLRSWPSTGPAATSRFCSTPIGATSTPGRTRRSAGRREDHGAREHEALARRRTSTSTGRTGITRRSRPRRCRTRPSTPRAQLEFRRPQGRISATCRARTPTATSAVFFPDCERARGERLLAVGRYPVLDYATGGWIGGLEAATRVAARGDGCARPNRARASAPSAARAELEAQLDDVHGGARARGRRVSSRHELRGVRGHERRRASSTPQRGDPDLFLKLVYKGAWAHVRELGGMI